MQQVRSSRVDVSRPSIRSWKRLADFIQNSGINLTAVSNFNLTCSDGAQFKNVQVSQGNFDAKCINATQNMYSLTILLCIRREILFRKISLQSSLVVVMTVSKEANCV